MDVQHAYDRWSDQYDTNANRTRDLEAVGLRALLEHVPFQRCLEIGCGTGKNTAWLVERAAHITAVDLSPGMLAKARAKITSERVRFVQADILQPWHFAEGPYDLATFSLVLEHIAQLAPVIAGAARVLRPGGHVYIGELHPFKQYTGTKARFTSEAGTQVVDCHDHHLSDFTAAAHAAGLDIVDVCELFDDGDRTTAPRILQLLLCKPDHA